MNRNKGNGVINLANCKLIEIKLNFFLTGQGFFYEKIMTHHHFL